MRQFKQCTCNLDYINIMLVCKTCVMCNTASYVVRGLRFSYSDPYM